MLKDFQIGHEDMVRHAISRSNVVINLVGQRTETMNYTFEDVHVSWPRMLAKWVQGKAGQQAAAAGGGQQLGPRA